MNQIVSELSEQLTHREAKMLKRLEQVSTHDVCGKVVAITGMLIQVSGLMLPVGHGCRLHLNNGLTAEAEVVAFDEDGISIMPYDDLLGVSKGTLVSASTAGHHVQVGMGLLGRVVNALGQPMDDQGALSLEANNPNNPSPINPLHRQRISKVIDVGVRAINGLMTTCEGQRMGIFAEAGLGKSVLLGMMTKFSSAEVVVVGLIGERGREVKEFIDDILGPEGLKKTVVVAAPADTSPLMKITAAHYATTISEYFRDQGKNVLLIVDSITRYAQAYRQMALSDGEMPTAKGYTPTVFSKLSHLIERSGNGVNPTGSITAFYTVLTEAEEMADPIAEHVRSLIDGHIILSRELAEEGHFPAINIEKSISRLMPNLVQARHQQLAMGLKRLISAYLKNKDMINIGMYQTGADAYVDAAIAHWDSIRNYLTQGVHERASLEDSIIQLEQLLKHAGLVS